jgi:hypothetical protein
MDAGPLPGRLSRGSLVPAECITGQGLGVDNTNPFAVPPHP